MIGFRRSEQIDQIGAAMAAAQSQMGPVPRTKTATVPMKGGGKYSYTYADLSDLIEVMRKPLSDNGLAIIQTPVTETHEKDETVALFTLVTHTSGQWLEVTLDTGRYANEPQQVGAAITYYKRYTLQSLGLIAAEGDTDGKSHHDAPRRQPDPQPAPDGQTKTQRLIVWAKKNGRLPEAKIRAIEQFGIPLADLDPSQASQLYKAMTSQAAEPPPPVPEPEPVPEPLPVREVPDEPQGLLPAPEGQSKAQKLASWCERHGHTQRAGALAHKNYGCTLEKLNGDQADFVYTLLVDSKPVANLPTPDRKGKGPAEPQGATNQNGNPVAFGWPTSGSGLYAWCKNLEGAYGIALIRELDKHFGERTPFAYPRQFRDWNAMQVESGARHAARLVAKQPGYDGQFDEHIPDLDMLKQALAKSAFRMLENLGKKSTWEGVVAICREYSMGLEESQGEVLDDLENCQSEELIQNVKNSLDRDLKDAGVVMS